MTPSIEVTSSSGLRLHKYRAYSLLRRGAVLIEDSEPLPDDIESLLPIFLWKGFATDRQAALRAAAF
jgi:hypothetical protein